MPKNKNEFNVKPVEKKDIIHSSLKADKKQNTGFFETCHVFLSTYSNLLIKTVFKNRNYTRYNTKSEISTFQGRPIVLTHVTPKLTKKERERREREVENDLFEVFSKYQ
jgi:hypothetical protein